MKAVAAALKRFAGAGLQVVRTAGRRGRSGSVRRKNPLDRVRELYLLTKDIRLIRWLCNEAGGFFVSNPVPELRKSIDEQIYGETRSMMKEFSELLDAVTTAVEDDPYVDADEADEIRQRWEDLKACVERFVISCEKGHYHLKKKDVPKK